MTVANRYESLILLIGDLFFFYFALWLSLIIRYAVMPTTQTLVDHLIPFSILFTLWLLCFFIAGLYEKHTLLLRSRLPNILLTSQIINVTLAVFLFYFLPIFDIKPKTVLLVYLAVSSALIFAWRLFGYNLFRPQKKQNAIIIGSGEELRELRDEINKNPRYNLTFISSIDLEKIEGLDFKTEVTDRIYSEGVSTIVVDFKSEKIEPILPQLYNLIFSGVRFIDMYRIYEDIFDRIPLSLLKYSWFLENISASSHRSYDILKRTLDLLIALFLGFFSLFLYPFVYLAIKLEDGGAALFVQTRIGQGDRPFKIYKFRTMQRTEDGVWIGETTNKITTVGKFLRSSRIDEFPQIWSVIKGDQSFIGPRPDLSGLSERLRAEIPYYNIRNLIKPGLSGWAQIKQSYKKGNISPQSLDETKRRLSYDLYYIKNRSFMLDVKIALQTLRIFISRVGV